MFPSLPSLLFSSQLRFIIVARLSFILLAFLLPTCNKSFARFGFYYFIECLICNNTTTFFHLLYSLYSLYSHASLTPWTIIRSAPLIYPRASTERFSAPYAIMFGQLRSNRSTALVAGAVVFLIFFVSLAYNHLDNWEPAADV